MSGLGLLAPVARQREFTDLGVVAPGALLHTFLTESSTPQPVYTTNELDVEHTNPLEADAGGLFPAFWLANGVAYRFTLTEANGDPIWGPVDGILTGGNTTGQAGTVFDITAFGAVPGGVVDNRTAIQAAITAAMVAGGTVFIPLGTWRVSAQLLCTASNVRFQGEGQGSILQFDDAATNGGLRISRIASSTVVSSALASNVAIGDRTVTVGAGQGTNFAQGGWLLCSDGNTDHGTFITYIESIAGDILTMRDAAPCILTTASAATAFYRPQGVLTGNSVQDLTLKCASDAPTNMLILLWILTSDGPIVRNVFFSGTRAGCVNFTNVVNGLIEGCHSTNAISSNGEGFAIAASTNCRVSACIAERCQFGIDAAQSCKLTVVGNQVHARQTSSALGRGIKLANGSNFGTVTGNTIADPNFFGIYFQDSSHCVASSNTIYNCGGGAPGDDQHGIQSGGNLDDQCHHNVIANNTISFCSGFGVSITPTLLTTAKDLFNVVTGNTITDCKQGGILVFSCNRNVILGNNIRQVAATITQGGAIAIISAAAQNLVSLNEIYASTAVALVGVISTGGDGTNTVINNKLGPLVTVSTAVGDQIFTPTPTLMATIFETAARFGTTLNGAGANTYNSTGALLDTSATINSSAGLTLQLAPANASLYTGSPRFTAKFDLTAKGTDGQILISIGNTTVTGTTLTFTDPHAGFKVTWAASGVASLFATQATGGVETASAALTTLVATDSLEVMLQINGISSIEYYWRKNGGVWSPATILTATLPASGVPNILQAVICNSNVASLSSITMRYMSYSR